MLELFTVKIQSDHSYHSCNNDPLAPILLLRVHYLMVQVCCKFDLIQTTYLVRLLKKELWKGGGKDRIP